MFPALPSSSIPSTATATATATAQRAPRRNLTWSALALTLLLAPSCTPGDTGGDPTPHPVPMISHATANVGELEIHYVVSGQGSPIVLLPGWPQSWYLWRNVIPVLAEKHTVIAPDMRGMGDSSLPTGGYDKKTMAEDIHALVVSLGYDTVSLAGHDVGGMVAYAYASEHPEGVEKAIFIDSPIPSEAFYQFPALSPQGGIWWFGFHSVPDLPETLITGKEREYFSWFFQSLATNKNAIAAADVEEYVRGNSRPGALHAGLEYYRAFPQDIEDNAGYAKVKLPMPVLAIGGANSTGPLIGQMLEPLAADVRTEVIADCGHWVAEEKPEELSQLLLDFLAEGG